MSPAGTVLDPDGIVIGAGEGYQRRPSLAFDGTNFLVVWESGYSAQVTGPGMNIHGARVTPAGIVLDPPLPGGPGPIPIATATGDQSDPAVAFRGSRFLVVWTDARSAASLDLYGARVTKLGVVEDTSGIPISTAPGDQDRPDVAATGTFLVVWRDRRSGTSRDIYASRVTDKGVVKDAAGLPIASGPTDEDDPVVTSSRGRHGIAYSRFSPESSFGSSRTYLRTFAPK